jgi:hypothetical protein
VLQERRAPEVDAVVKAGPFTFMVEWRGTSNAGAIALAVEKLQHEYQTREKNIPLVAVPFMGEVGRKRCAEAGVSWLDLSGNARIIGPGLRIIVEGKPNLFKRRGRPSSAFAPKSSRIARWLLMHPEKAITQRELARATDMDEGFTSRIVAKLAEDNLIVWNQRGSVKPRDLDLLLDAWREEYDFEKHYIIRGHIPARSGDALVRQIAGALAKASVDYAASGLAAAWLMDRFAGFRIATVYLHEEPSPELLEGLSFHEDESGANTWLVIPNDAGVFHGASVHDRIPCVHQVQVYLDLKGHPERSKEAAEKLRADHLNRRRDAR